jgi:hypothetical protein
MFGRRLITAAAILVLGVSAFASPTRVAAADPVMVGAGDIASCTRSNDEATAELLDSVAGSVFTLGDNAYTKGTAAQFRDCYAPTWGRHLARTHPSVGNHEYMTKGASGYYGYFGAAAGSKTKGYYSYDLGAWHIVVLNSSCADVSCSSTSAQVSWLKTDLAAHPDAHVLAYWHEPRFSSGVHGGNPAVQAFWETLYAAGADIVLNGHDHDYEGFAAQDPWGRADDAHGIREFVVGTGGEDLRVRASTAANSQVFSATFGVLKLTLHADSYDWAFVPVAGSSFTDSGTGTTHEAPPARTRHTFTVTSDAWVDQAHKTTNHGTSSRLLIDGDTGSGFDARSFVRATVSGVTGTIDRAALRLWVTNATRDGPTIAPTTTTWSGKTITWANQPAATGPAVSDAEVVPAGFWVDLDVTSIVTGDGAYGFVLRPTSGDALEASSMQGVHAPRLIVETVATP